MITGKLNVDKLHLREFRLLKGQIDSPFDFDSEMVEGFQFEIGFETGFDLSKKLIRVNFQVKISTEAVEGYEQKATGYFEFAYIFEVDNIEELVTPQDNAPYKIDSRLANAISTISYSTSRGVLLTRFQGTALANFMLPVFDPDKLILQTG